MLIFCISCFSNYPSNMCSDGCSIKQTVAWKDQGSGILQCSTIVNWLYIARKLEELLESYVNLNRFESLRWEVLFKFCIFNIRRACYLMHKSQKKVFYSHFVLSKIICSRIWTRWTLSSPTVFANCVLPTLCQLF